MASGSLGHLAATVTLNIDPFKQSSQALTSMIKSTNSALKMEDAAVKAYGNSLNGLKTHYATMQQQMSNYNAKLKEQEETYKKAMSATAKTSEEQQKLTARQQNAATAINKTKTQMAALDSEMQQANRQIALQESGWQKASDKMTSFGNSATQAGQKMSSIGSNMTMKVTTPIVAGFGYAAKSAVEFNSEIANISPLLKANGESASQVSGEMVKMSSASKQWATEYGISTNQINSGLEEMVKRGYSANQAMGAMPSVLAAAKASGDDFNTVMAVSTSTLEQFGLKSNTTAGMLKNTQRVTDTLTYTANATAAGFQDMGDAMTYVGPTAHAAGISLEETAAAIGLMSNQGIEGSVAGTALRSALTRLMKPSKQNAEGFRELGINVEDFKNHSLTLPEILDKIKTNTAGWTDEQRASAIAMAFGTEAQAGMNALVNEGGDALTDLTNKTKEAKGSTQAIADEMNNTSQAKVARFKESLHVLAITVGEKLTPTFIPLIEGLTKTVTKFSEMDDSTQQSIIKWVALAAAAGPVISIFGKMTSAAGGTMSAIGALTGGISRWKIAADEGAGVGGKLASMFSKTSFEANMFGNVAKGAGAEVSTLTGATEAGAASMGGLSAASGEAAASSGLLAGALSPVGLAVIGTTLAIGAGIGVWELWGKKAYESSVETSKWGTTVGHEADKSLSKIQDFNGQAGDALDNFDSNVQGNAQNISDSFKGMSDEIGQAGKDANKKLNDALKDLPKGVSSIVEDGIKKQKKANDKIVSEAKRTSDNVSRITKDAAKGHRKLTDDENQYILNSQKKMNEDEVKILGLSGNKKKSVLQALNGDMKNISKKEAADRMDTLKDAMKQEQDVYKKRADQLKDLRKNDKLTEKDYNKAMKELRKENTDSLRKQGDAFIEYGKKAGYTVTPLKNSLSDLGLSYDDLVKRAQKSEKSVSTSNSRIADTASKMNDVSKKAGEDWNKMVLDPKTGKIKTNAQETINDTAKTEQGWNKLKFELKHAKLSTNAKSMIGEAAIESGRWNDMTWREKKAMVRVNDGSKEGNKLTDVVKHIKDWNAIDPKQQEAIIRAKGQDDLARAMIDANQWNNMSMKDKKALIKSEGSRDLVDMLTQAGVWNNLSVKSKEAVVKGKGTGELVDQIIQLGKWNDLPLKEKETIVKDKAQRTIIDAMVAGGQWNSLTMDEKNAVVKNKATAELMQSMLDAGTWNSLTLDQKDAIIHDKASANMVNALNQAGLWQNLDMETKDAIVEDKASSPIIASLIQAGKWNDLPVSEKEAIINTGKSASDLANLISSYGGWNDLPEKQKNLIVNDASARQMLIDAGILIDNYNKKDVPIKKLNADDQDAIKKLKNGESYITSYNGKQVEVKKINANNVDITAKIDQSKASVQSFNDKKAETKKLKGDSTDVKNKSNESVKAVDSHNKKKTDTKSFKGNSTDAVNKAKEARNAVNSWNAMSPVVHFFKSIYQKITKNAKGTTDFEGGLSYVNDETGSMFRELVKLPTGEMFIPEGRNILLDLPAHSQVVPARETNRLMGGIRQFASGTPGYSTVVNDLSNLNPGLTEGGSDYTTNNTTSNLTKQNIQNFHTEVTINTTDSNGKDLGQQVASVIESEMRKAFNSESSAFGGGHLA